MKRLNTENAFAIITGASSGIGLEYAIALARDYRYNLLLVSNQEQELNELAERLTADYHVRAIPFYLDLTAQDAAEQVVAFCDKEQLDVEVLINNAGVLIFDAFVNTNPQKIETLLMLHVVTLTKLCRLIAAKMLHRPLIDGHKKGYILNMSSMSAWMSMPSIACYNASKGYVFNFSKALWYELKPRGIRVLAVTPGSTDTGLLPFGPALGKVLRFFGITMSPARLVKRALKVLFTSSKKRCMPGAWNYIIVPIINHLPDWLIFAAMKRIPFFKQ